MICWQTNDEKDEFPANGSTGQRGKAPAESVCLITLMRKAIRLPINKLKEMAYASLVQYKSVRNGKCVGSRR
jgi:hypothetical protein